MSSWCEAVSVVRRLGMVSRTRPSVPTSSTSRRLSSGPSMASLTTAISSALTVSVRLPRSDVRVAVIASRGRIDRVNFPRSQRNRRPCGRQDEKRQQPSWRCPGGRRQRIQCADNQRDKEGEPNNLGLVLPKRDVELAGGEVIDADARTHERKMRCVSCISQRPLPVGDVGALGTDSSPTAGRLTRRRRQIRPARWYGAVTPADTSS